MSVSNRIYSYPTFIFLILKCSKVGYRYLNLLTACIASNTNTSIACDACVKSLISAQSQWYCTIVTVAGHFSTSAEMSRPKDQSVRTYGPNCLVRRYVLVPKCPRTLLPKCLGCVLSWVQSVAAILGGPGGQRTPHFPEWGVTYKAVTPQFWRHVDVTFFALYTCFGRRRLSFIKFCFDLGPP